MTGSMDSVARVWIERLNDRHEKLRYQYGIRQRISRGGRNESRRRRRVLRRHGVSLKWVY